MSVEMTRRLLSAKEVAQYLGLHLVTIYDLATRREIPSVKIGRRRLFDPRELERWIEERTVREQGSRPRIEELLSRRRRGQRSRERPKAGAPEES